LFQALIIAKLKLGQLLELSMQGIDLAAMSEKGQRGGVVGGRRQGEGK
jgi:hypothetical protein